MTPPARQQTFAAFDESLPPPPPSQGGAAAIPAAEEALSPIAPEVVPPRKVYVIDAHALIYQVFHAMPEMTGPGGQPVGAVQGFIRDLLDLIENRGAEYIFCAFDHPGPTFRHELSDQYKIQRQEMPVDLQLQMPVIRRFVEALGIPSLSTPGFEADDILATIARQVEESGGTCYLVTSDKDCRQLISEQVKMYNIRKNEVFDEVALQAVWGIRPDQVVDFQSLIGDKVDNVPGVPLIGPKIAQELLSKYDTLDGIFAHLDDLPSGKRKENLQNGQQAAFDSRELVRLNRHVPMTFDWDLGRVGRLQAAELVEICRECGFRQLSTRIERLAKKYANVIADNAAEIAATPVGGETLPAEDARAAPMSTQSAAVADETPWQVNYRTIATSTELAQLVAEMLEQKRIVLDTETTSTLPRWAEIVGYSFAWRQGEGYYIPVRAPADEPQLDPAGVLEALRPVLENEAIEKIGQNIKYDMVVLRSAGVELRGAAFDTMVADYLLSPGERTHNMDDLARRHLQHTTITIDQLIGSGKNQKRMDEVSVALVTQYAAEDADVPLRLADLLEPRLREEGLHEMFATLEMPLIQVLAELEFNGIRVDRARLEELGHGFAGRIAQLEKEIYEIAGGEFNIDSRLQLGKLLFETFQLPILKKTKTGPSMDAEVLEDLAKLHPLPAKIIEYRQNAKLKSTYIDALQGLIHPTTQRVHTSFKQDVAATGRLSSQDPNLQNIPVRSEQGRAIRSAFLPGPSGWRLMTADYSQIELRVLAHFSSDAALLAAFAEDRDIHTQVASQVYSVPLAEVTRDMRRSAKAINFGVIYGQSPFGLAKALDIPQDEAARFIDAYFAQYPGVDSFMQQTLRDCRQRGFVSTISGRRRPVQGVRDIDTLKDKRQRTLPERIAINTVIQGSAADIIKQAMIGVYRRLQREKLQARMLLQIHDELVFEFPPEEQQALAALVVEEMASAAQLQTPLKIDVKTGLNWAECEALE